MPNWVVPSIAADIWQIPVDQVLAHMQEGKIPSRTEGGFTFVDIEAREPELDARPVIPTPRPVTYRQLTSEELIALHADPSPAKSADPFQQTHWREARRVVGFLRQAPRPD
jgi:hypothetical protein